MPDRIVYARHRLEIAKLVMALIRFGTGPYLGHQRVAPTADEALLCGAIFIGQAEKRPMTAANLADYTGMPRTTVIRKLRALVESGHVEMVDGFALLPLERLNSQQMLEGVRGACRHIHRAAERLSKLDR